MGVGLKIAPIGMKFILYIIMCYLIAKLSSCSVSSFLEVSTKAEAEKLTLEENQKRCDFYNYFTCDLQKVIGAVSLALYIFFNRLNHFSIKF